MPVTINGNNTPTAGGVVYGDGSTYASTTAGSAGSVLYSAGASAPAFTAVGTSGYLLQSNGAAAPSWVVAPSGASAATPTALGTVYGTTANQNAGLGSGALNSATTAATNVAIGYQALYTGTTLGSAGGGSVAVGWRSGYSMGNVGYFTALGNQAGYSCVTEGVFIGYQAGYSNTTGDSNTALGGYNTLYSNTTGSKNTALGREALTSNTTASYNTAVGYQAAYGITTSENNVAVGYRALYTHTTGNRNTALGFGAGTAITTGTQNVCVGHSAGGSMTSGNGNTIIGADISPVGTGASNTWVGSGVYGSTNVQQTVGIAAPNVGSTIRSITIGWDISAQGNDHVTFGSGSGRIYNNFASSATWTQTSDGTLKNIVGADTLGLSFINRLNPIKFTWKAQNELPTDHPLYQEVNLKDTATVIHGFIAQEVKTALDAEGCSTFNGWSQGSDGVQGISREMFISPLVKAIQELSAQVKTLKAEVAALKGN